MEYSGPRRTALSLSEALLEIQVYFAFIYLTNPRSFNVKQPILANTSSATFRQLIVLVFERIEESKISMADNSPPKIVKLRCYRQLLLKTVI